MVEIIANYRRFGKPSNPSKGFIYTVVSLVFSGLPPDYHVVIIVIPVVSQSVSVNLSVTILAFISVAVSVIL